MKFRLLLFSAALIGASSNLAMGQTIKLPEAKEATSSTEEPSTQGGGGSGDSSRAEQERSTGPVNTTEGGVTPSSPQGDSPPGMQPQPKGPEGQDAESSGSSR